MIILLLHVAHIQAQKTSVFKSFFKLSRPEKCWVMRHPFIAKKAFIKTQDVLKITDSIAKTTVLDGDKNGGQVDAFRHAYWMALLSKHFGRHKALRLGRAHEKGNHIDYKKHRLEEGTHPDKVSSDMDLYNNIGGAALENDNKTATDKELQTLVINAIKAGKMKIIKKDSHGNFLDKDNTIIPADSLKGKWENGKCLINSDWKFIPKTG